MVTSLGQSFWSLVEAGGEAHKERQAAGYLGATAELLDNTCYCCSVLDIICDMSLMVGIFAASSAGLHDAARMCPKSRVTETVCPT